jgi:3-oxoacyl-[acyl-carrier-protein] synthase II
VDHLALASAREALSHAKLLDLQEGCVYAPRRTGIVVGTAAGGILGLERFFRKRFLKQPVQDPRPLLSSFCLSAIATNLAREFLIQGPRLTIATVCSSSGLALAAAKELLETEALDHVLVVGAETLSEVTLAGFNSLRSVAPDRCRPFDLNRNGLVLGEGAGALVLERSASCRARQVHGLSRLAGYGLTTDVHHFTAPQPLGDAIAEAIEKALENAHLPPTAVDHVNAHGTGTPLNDLAETRGLKTALGSRAGEIPICSNKSMIGHALGAASILEAIPAILALDKGLVPPTANLKTQDPECDLDYVAQSARRAPIQCVLSNSFAFGGSNISLVFCKDRPKPEKSGEGEGNPYRTPVITGMGLVTPFGVGRQALVKGLIQNRSPLMPLGEIGPAWAHFTGGLVNMSAAREQVPPPLRRRLNRQGVFLFLSLREALSDAKIGPRGNEGLAITYGSAFGCSGNVHRFYTQMMSDGPRFASPQEFNLSVTNAPPALVAQNMGLKGPIWVFVADEASWEHALHWAASLIRSGKLERALVTAAEEISDSVMAIHHELGLLQSPEHSGLVLGEGAVCMVLESEEAAIKRSAPIYGKVIHWATAQDSRCGPLDFSSHSDLLTAAAAVCLETIDGQAGDLLWVSPANGNPTVEAVADRVGEKLTQTREKTIREARFRPRFGESGICGGFSLAASLLDRGDAAAPHVLVLTTARGGIHAASLVQRTHRGERSPKRSTPGAQQTRKETGRQT